MRMTLWTAAALTLSLTAAQAQDSHEMHDMAAAAGSEAAWPAGCEAAAPATETSAMAGGMEGMTAGEGSDAAQKASMDAMMRMHGPMTRAAMIENPDLAFNCGMIAHHQGAIDMAEIELEHGADAASRELARRIIDDQTREIAEMTAWVEAHVE